MITLTAWQLVLIIIGAAWLGGMAGLFLSCLLFAAGRADDVTRRHWMETE